MLGEQGVLKTDSPTVVCGLCGRTFKALGPRILSRHGLSAAEYRERFGLKASTGLVSPELRQRQREQSAHLAPYRGAANAASLRGLTPEQRHRPKGQPIRKTIVASCLNEPAKSKERMVTRRALAVRQAGTVWSKSTSWLHCPHWLGTLASVERLLFRRGGRTEGNCPFGPLGPSQ